MPTNQVLDDEKFKDFGDQDPLKKRTLLDRERLCKHFADYLEEKMVNEKDKDLIVENRFHRQLIGAKGGEIEKIRKEFTAVQISFPDLGS